MTNYKAKGFRGNFLVEISADKKMNETRKEVALKTKSIFVY